MKKYLFTIVALFCTTLLFAQEYMVVEGSNGETAIFDISTIRQISFIQVELKGSGTEADPFNVAAAVEYIKGLGADTPSENELFITGYVRTVREAFNVQYGNAQFTMADTEYSMTTLTFYRGLYFGNEMYSDATALNVNVGDKVVVRGKVVYYRGTTPETVQGQACIVSINGQTEGGGTGGETGSTGTATNPLTASQAYNIVAAMEGGVTSEEVYYIKGKISSIRYTFSAQYGTATFNITDDGTESDKQFMAYGCYYLGNKAWEDGNTQIAIGDNVILCGKVINYNGNTPETANKQAYIYSLNGATAENGQGGGGGQTIIPAGTGTQADPFNVAAAVAKCKEAGTTATTEIYYVKGIVNADYTIDSYKNATFDMVDYEGASEKFKAYRVKGADGQALKEGYKIPKGATVIVSGKLMNYNGNTPETAQNSGTLISVNGQAPQLDGEEGGGGGEAATSLTNGNFETWANNLPTGWKSASTASSATLEQSTDAHGGNYACIVKGNTTANKRLASQEIKLAAGSYNFSFWVKPTSENIAQVRPGYVPVVDGAVGNYTYEDYTTLSAGWQQISYDFTLDAETTVCLIVMNPKSSNYSSGEDVIVDDATLTKK